MSLWGWNGVSVCVAMRGGDKFRAEKRPLVNEACPRFFFLRALQIIPADPGSLAPGDLCESPLIRTPLASALSREGSGQEKSL
jgi:hypothetical protein